MDELLNNNKKSKSGLIHSFKQWCHVLFPWLYICLLSPFILSIFCIWPSNQFFHFLLPAVCHSTYQGSFCNKDKSKNQTLFTSHNVFVWPLYLCVALINPATVFLPYFEYTAAIQALNKPLLSVNNVNNTLLKGTLAVVTGITLSNFYQYMFLLIKFSERGHDWNQLSSSPCHHNLRSLHGNQINLLLKPYMERLDI